MAAPIVIFHLSDIHFGLEDARALDWARSCIAAERPAAVAITGDLTMRARHREYTAACNWIQSLGAPVSVEVGNHDMPYFNLWERFTDPYRRYRSIETMVEAEIDLPGLAIVPLRTTARAQWRFPWSNGWITAEALAETLAAIDALPAGTRVLVAAHHPLVERGAKGQLLTRGGSAAMAELARRGVLAVLSGHIHDPFDRVEQTPQGPLRMIGAGTLSRRLRSTPPSFNQIVIDGTSLRVTHRNLEAVPNSAMRMEGPMPDSAEPPRDPQDASAPAHYQPDAH